MDEIGLASHVATSATHNSDGPLTGSLGPPGERIVKAMVLPFSEKETLLIHMPSGMPVMALCTPSSAGTTSVESTRAKPERCTESQIKTIIEGKSACEAPNMQD